MELAVSSPPPSPLVRTEEKDEFDPGRVTVSRRFGSGMPGYSRRPGFALLRMHEEAGLPMKCGIVNVASKAIADAALWVEPFAPLWTLASNIRAANKEFLKETFDRVRIATLTEKEVSSLYRLLSRTILDANKEVSPAAVEDKGIPLLCEILSRLSFRLPPAELDRLFDLAVKLYLSANQAWLLLDCVKSLFERLLFAASAEKVLTWAPRLLALPIPTEGGFEVPHDERWPEPCEFIDWRGRKFSAADRDPKFTSAISFLLRVAREGTAQARPRALWRLDKLLPASLLTKEEETLFAQALWARLDSNTDLPAETGVYAFAFLRWPAPNPELTKEKLRQLLLRKSIPEIVQVREGTDGKKQKTIDFRQASSSFFRELFGVTKSPWKNEPTAIDWSPEEAVVLLKKAASWWDREKQFIDNFEEVRTQLTHLPDFLSDIVLPRLALADRESIELATRITAEMDNLKISVLHVLPALTRFNNSSEVAAQRILAGLEASEKLQVQSAIHGVYLWAVYAKANILPAVPEQVVSGLIIRILALRQPALETALAQMSEIISSTPNVITEEHFSLLDVALRFLLIETELPVSTYNLEQAESEPINLPISKRPFYRQLAARLAYTMFLFAKQHDRAIPRSINAWQSISRNGPLPEVSRQWRETQ